MSAVFPYLSMGVTLFLTLGGRRGTAFQIFLSPPFLSLSLCFCPFNTRNVLGRTGVENLPPPRAYLLEVLTQLLSHLRTFFVLSPPIQNEY